MHHSYTCQWRNQLSVHQLVGLSTLLATLMFNTAQGWADSWEQTVSTRFSTEYDTNPTMTPEYPGSAWRALFEPSYTLTGRLDMDELTTGLALQMSRSSNETLSPNRDSPSVFIDWLRHIEASEFGISSRYTEVATRNFGIDATGQVPLSSTRASRTVSGRWRQALSERSTFSAIGAYESIFYSGGNYIDYATRSASMMFRYAWSENNTPFIIMSYVDYEPADGGPTGQLDTATLGWNWRASDNLELTLQGGKYHNSEGETANHGAAIVQYTGQYSAFMLNAQRQVAPSGLGGFVTVDQANASWSYDLNERSKTGVDVAVQRNLATDIINRTEGVWLQNDLDSFWSMRLYYQHNHFYGGAVQGASANILGFAFVYTHPDF